MTVVIVTSPSPSNPSTVLVDCAINSLNYVQGLETAPVIIVADGYKVRNKSQSKRGIVTQTMADAYEKYLENLQEKYGMRTTVSDPVHPIESNSSSRTISRRYALLRCPEHFGFAHAVKYGLERCSTSSTQKIPVADLLTYCAVPATGSSNSSTNPVFVEEDQSSDVDESDALVHKAQSKELHRLCAGEEVSTAAEMVRHLRGRKLQVPCNG